MCLEYSAHTPRTLARFSDPTTPFFACDKTRSLVWNSSRKRLRRTLGPIWCGYSTDPFGIYCKYLNTDLIKCSPFKFQTSLGALFVTHHHLSGSQVATIYSYIVFILISGLSADNSRQSEKIAIYWARFVAMICLPPREGLVNYIFAAACFLLLRSGKRIGVSW